MKRKNKPTKIILLKDFSYFEAKINFSKKEISFCFSFY